MTGSNWELAHEYGQGCKAYVDSGSLASKDGIVRVKIKHYLVPPGTDHRNQKPVQEVVFDKEFDLERKQTRYHSIMFIYTDGSIADPLRADPKWTPADKGSLSELEYVRSRVAPRRKRWWLF